MIAPRARQLTRISNTIQGRTLLWFGIRGDDALPLLSLPEFQDCFSISAPLISSAVRSNESMEEFTGIRVDLDAYDIDEDSRPIVEDFRRSLMSRLNRQSVILNYRPSHFISNIGFAMHETTRALGMFKDRQSAYEYKPWVETELARRGIRTIPWRYIADEFRQRAASMLEDGPKILRISRASGGAGIELIRTAEELESAWPHSSDHLVALGPYLGGALPINVGAVVHDTNTITLHPGSVQLIGIPHCTSRPFGYCGNDMAAFANLGKDRISQVETAVREVGRWLGQEGYRGAFGVDFLLDGDVLYFAEVNARLQGSTALSSALASESGHVDIMIDHLSALLGIAPTETLSLSEWCEELPQAGQVIVHNLEGRQAKLAHPKHLWELGGNGFDPQLLPKPDIHVDPGAILARLTTRCQITEDGFSLKDGFKGIPLTVARAYVPVPNRVESENSSKGLSDVYSLGEAETTKMPRGRR